MQPIKTRSARSTSFHSMDLRQYSVFGQAHGIRGR
jgi:hypothetical protein